MNHVKNCRAYWKCILGKSYGMCCPEGKRYKPYVGCITDPKCDDACPPLTAGLGACDNRMIFGDPNHFEQFVPGMGWIKMPCPLGTQYNAVDCGCTTHGPSPNPDKGKIYNQSILEQICWINYIQQTLVSISNNGLFSTVCRPEVYLPFDKDTEDKSGNNVHIQNNNVSVVEGVAYFNGEAELIIPRFSNFEYTELVVAFTYLETPPCQEVTALISNSDCCTSTPTMAIVKSYKNVHFLAKCNGGLVTTFKLPLHVSFLINSNLYQYILYVYKTLKL